MVCNFWRLGRANYYVFEGVLLFSSFICNHRDAWSHEHTEKHDMLCGWLWFRLVVWSTCCFRFSSAIEEKLGTTVFERGCHVCFGSTGFLCPFPSKQGNIYEFFISLEIPIEAL